MAWTRFRCGQIRERKGVERFQPIDRILFCVVYFQVHLLTDERGVFAPIRCSTKATEVVRAESVCTGLSPKGGVGVLSCGGTIRVCSEEAIARYRALQRGVEDAVYSTYWMYME